MIPNSIKILFLIGATCAFYTGNDGIIELTDANFDNLVTKNDQFWIVEFYSPNCIHCKNLAPEYKKLGSILKGIAKVGAIDATVHRSISSRIGIKGFPSIFIFGEDKKKPIEYNSERTAVAIIDDVRQKIVKTIDKRLGKKKQSNDKSKSKKSEKGSGEVVTLTSENFEKLVINSKNGWMVEFFAPWCGHCKRLEPEWKSAAKEMGGLVKFGAVDATVYQELASRFNVRGYPTILYFGPGSNENDAESYDGGRTASDLVAFATSKSEQFAPDVEVVEAVNKKIVQETCEGKQLCIFAFLPNILDCQSKCRKQHIAMLTNLGNSFKTRKWGWVWSEAGSQPNVEETFGVGGFGYPALAVLSPNKMKYSVLLGSFGSESIKEFLNGISYGKSRVNSVPTSKLLDGFLNVEKIQEWDGKDGKIPEMEEIDLSDVKIEL